jgi:predicted acyl esterase
VTRRRARAGAATLACAAIAAAAAPPPSAAAPLDDLLASCAPAASAGERPSRHRICSASVASFDGAPLDVTLTLPARPPRRRLPLVVFLHGLLNHKGEYLSATREGTGPDRGGEVYKTVEWNNVWFASRGYAVLNYSARGHGASGGRIELASRHVEVRDTHHLTGLLADEARVGIDPRRVGVLGGSYGGGQAWLLLATRGEDAPAHGTWRSPEGRLVRIAALVPQFTWTDLLEALVPTGRQRSDGLVEAATAGRPLGVPKQTIVNGFLATSQGKLPDYATRWVARMNAGEPYEDDPIVEEARRGLTLDRSAYFQDAFFRALRRRGGRRVPVLAAQGWTDPIFPALDAVRMYRGLRDADRRYPIALYFGDFEHLTALVKVPEFRYLHRLGNRLLDWALRGRGRRPPLDVRSARTSCDREAFGPVRRARDWDGLARDRLVLELGGPRTTASPLADPRGPATDPVLVSQQHGRGCIRTALGPTPGVATYEVALDGPVELVGMPLLRLRYRTAASDAQLNARLWDVAPDGTQTLVTRGAHRVLRPDPSGETAEYELFGNHWRFEPGHRLLLEVTQDDSPYLRRDNVASTVAIDAATLTLPTR